MAPLSGPPTLQPRWALCQHDSFCSLFTANTLSYDFFSFWPRALQSSPNVSPDSMIVPLWASLTESSEFSYQSLYIDKLYIDKYISSFPGDSDGKYSACNVGDPGSIPGLGRCPGEGNNYPLIYTCLENSIYNIISHLFITDFESPLYLEKNLHSFWWFKYPCFSNVLSFIEILTSSFFKQLFIVC